MKLKTQNESQIWQHGIKTENWKFKTTMTNMVRALMKKADNLQLQIGKGSRDGNSKNELKGYTRN